MFGFGFQAVLICEGVARALAEQEEFKKYLETLPSDEAREKAIAERKERLRIESEARQRETERREYLEAVKPHNLWSFLGLGKK